MFEKVSQAAEQAATNVSRRRFLGRIGRGAGVAAAAFAGLLVHAAPAWAGKRTRVCWEHSTQPACQGKPYGSYNCTSARGGELQVGRCVSNQKAISPGVYDCNVCQGKGKPSKGGGRG